MRRVIYLPIHHTKLPYKYMAIGGLGDDGKHKPKIQFCSKRYDKTVTVNCPYRSDGATSAPDINSDCWWFHDVLCDRGTWDDGTPLTNWQCSSILYDIMYDEGYNFFRRNRWRYSTFLLGGGEARKNGLFRLKDDRKVQK